MKMAAIGTAQDPARAVALKLLAVALFVAMGACVKAARDVVPTGEAVFFRSLFALPPILVYAWWRGRVVEALTAHDKAAHLWRGLCGAAAMWLGFTALGLLPLPELIAINHAVPLITTALAAWLLGETVRLYRWSAVVVGLLGVLVMLRPRLGALAERGFDDAAALGAAAALCGTALMGLAAIQVRRLVQTETTMSVVFWFTLICTASGLATLPFGWVAPAGKLMWLLITAGLLGGTAQILLTESYRRADASTLAPFDYSSLLYGVLIGWAVFGEVPGVDVTIGAAIVVAAGLFIIYREHRLRIDRSRQRSVGGAT